MPQAIANNHPMPDLPRLLIVSHFDLGWASDNIYRGFRSAFKTVDVVSPPIVSSDFSGVSQGYTIHTVAFRNGKDFANGFDFVGLYRVIDRIKPAVIFGLTEPFYSYILQMAWMRRLKLINARILFYGFENLPIGDG